MDSLNRIFRAILWGVVTGGLLSYIRLGSSPVLGDMRHGQRRGKSPAIRLHRDPVCGTYVSPEISVTLEKSGHITHFCSANCRECYARLSGRVAGA